MLCITHDLMVCVCVCVVNTSSNRTHQLYKRCISKQIFFFISKMDIDLLVDAESP